MGLRAVAMFLLAWVVLLGQIEETRGRNGCARCAGHCPMRPENARRDLPCHGSGEAKKQPAGGCTLHAACAHSSSTLPTEQSVALLLPRTELPALARALAAVPSAPLRLGLRAEEPPTDPPRISFV